MLFGGNDEIRKIKAAFVATNSDMSVVKPWLRVYEKTRKEAINCAGKYYSEKEKLEKLLAELKELESMIIGYEKLEGSKKSRFSDIIRDFKKMQGNIDYEFLISKADNDFHSTLTSIVKIAPAYIKDNENGVILQSEIENLMAMTKEGLERKHPELFALSYFYLEHSDKDLADMNFSQKVETVNAIYEEHFIRPIRIQLEKAIEKGKKDGIKPFLDAPDADSFLKKICRI